jgi:hypothetical protein
VKAMIAKFAPQNFNDFLCLFILGAIITMWLLDGFKKITLNGEVLGSTIAFFALVGQYYFRKRAEEK